MKWGGKKSAHSSSASPSPTSIVSHVFPTSWFSKFKKKGGISDPSKTKQQGQELFFATPNSWSEGRFYNINEDDAYWRLSFSQEKIQAGRRSTGGIKIDPPWHDFDNDLPVPVSSFNSLVLQEMDVVRREEENRNFSDMVSELKRMKGRQKAPMQDTTRDAEAFTAMLEERNSRNLISRGEREGLDKTGHLFKDISCGEKTSLSEWQDMVGDGRFKELRIKTGNKSATNSRKTNRLKAHSPRTEFKIRALEEMKKTRMKWKKDKTVFDSFAVVKNSFDPQQDFRDSMVEMIRERGIDKPEDLEKLLACYLSLNYDEYHGLIIKVFRQVLFELNEEPANQFIIELC